MTRDLDMSFSLADSAKGFGVMGIDELPEEDKLTVHRARKLQKQLSQPSILQKYLQVVFLRMIKPKTLGWSQVLPL